MVNGAAALASELARASAIETYVAGHEIIVQGAHDRDFYFLLLGSVVIERNGRAGPIRSAGNHVGELALIDVHERRTATLRSREETVVARISEPDLSRMAE